MPISAWARPKSGGLEQPRLVAPGYLNLPFMEERLDHRAGNITGLHQDHHPNDPDDRIPAVGEDGGKGSRDQGHGTYDNDERHLEPCRAGYPHAERDCRHHKRFQTERLPQRIVVGWKETTNTAAILRVFPSFLSQFAIGVDRVFGNRARSLRGRPLMTGSPPPVGDARPLLSFFIHDLRAGGAERNIVRLVNGVVSTAFVPTWC